MTISKDNLNFLQYFLDIKVKFLCFLPEEVDIKRTKVEDEEAFIGKCLKTTVTQTIMSCWIIKKGPPD